MGPCVSWGAPGGLKGAFEVATDHQVYLLENFFWY